MAAETQKRRTSLRMSFFFEMPDQSGYLQLGRSGLLAGGAFAPYKCFGPLAQNLGAGAALPPRAFKYRRVEAASGGRNPKQKATAFAVAFCFGTPEGTRIVPHEVCPDICCIKWVWLILEFISLKNIIDHYVLKGVKQFRRGKGHNKGQKSCDLSCDEQLALCSEIL